MSLKTASPARPAVVVILLALLASFLLPSTASAEPADADAAWTKVCYQGTGNRWIIDLPNKTDLDFWGDPCVHSRGNQLYASIYFAWGSVSTPEFGSGHKFDGFKVGVRLERRPNGGSTDTPLKATDCNITDKVNASWFGSYTCKTEIYTGYNVAYNYSSDGFVNFDVDTDGKTWLGVKEMHGSPFMY